MKYWCDIENLKTSNINESLSKSKKFTQIFRFTTNLWNIWVTDKKAIKQWNICERKRQDKYKFALWIIFSMQWSLTSVTKTPASSYGTPYFVFKRALFYFLNAPFQHPSPVRCGPPPAGKFYR